MRVLLVVLLLVLVAAATLVAAVLGGGSGLAWVSILASALGAGLLVVDRVRARRRKRTSTSRSTTPPAAPQGAEPGEERSNAAEAADPEAEVVVIDERPRYHVRTCDWLGEAETLSLKLGEARELGFTPCARCAPNATIASETRRSR